MSKLTTDDIEIINTFKNKFTSNLLPKVNLEGKNTDAIQALLQSKMKK